MTDATIRTERLSKRYGEREPWAVDAVTLTIRPGELTVLMGPSGSGKTTLLSMIGAILTPTSGRVWLLGTALEGLGEAGRQAFRRRHVGFVFQNYNLLSSLTAVENVRLALHLRGAPEREADELLDFVGLSDKADRLPARLSGGERQRVAIARALAGRPPILLADEPTAALDADQGRKVLGLLRDDARQRGTTVVVVTHDPRVRELADRVVELEDGRVSRVARGVPRCSGAEVDAR